ncbi:MAG: hypothetical protein ACRDS9_02685 [Pseudonocardiaceae bacterium]
MPDVTAKDLRAVLDVVYALGDDRAGGGMPSHVLALLRDLTLIIHGGCRVACRSSFVDLRLVG